MPRLIYAAATVTLLAVMAALPSACEKRPTRPSVEKIEGSPQSLEIRGHTAVHRPGDTSQLMAVAIYGNGAMEDATTRGASFAILDSSVAAVTATGFLRALKFGKTTLRLNCLQLAASAEIRVMPEGTFLITGRVTEEGGSHVPIPGAKIDVVMPRETLSTMTDSNGVFTLPATADATVRVEAANFYPQSFPVVATGDSRMDLSLRRSTRSLEGAWVLNFTAASGCTFPSNLTARRYIATISETGASLVVLLSGAEFQSGWFGIPGFTGSRSGDAVQFFIGDDWEFSFTEVLGNNRYLDFQGTAAGRVDETTVATTLDGTVTYIDGSTVYRCVAKDHRLDFVR